MSRFDTGLLLIPAQDEFNCDICKGVLDKPADLDCQHTFCTTCIKNWEAAKTSLDSFPCPLSRTEHDFMSERPSSLAFIKLLNKIDISCPQRCGIVTTIGGFDSHALTCQESIVACHHDNCHAQLPRREISAHLIECVHRRVQCTGICRLYIKARDLAEHDCFGAVMENVALLR